VERRIGKCGNGRFLVALPLQSVQIIAMSAIESSGKSSAGKIIAFIGCGCLGLVALVIIGAGAIFYFAMGAMKKSDAYVDSMAAVQSNPAAVAALGEPIKSGFMMSGSVNINNGEGTVDFSIPVSGPQGKGTIKVVGSKPAGATVWNYSTWQLEVEGSAEPIPLSR